ncbi:MAG: TraY domain-containing protein [Gammaproteobacteria bacterium]|jgi:RHH-type rel operon transcriptional repressor/antitoxin RelB|nr:TraY domain-containing protein [Gammaproteobacteria bacterium]
MLAIRLPEDIERRLAKLAEKTGRTKTFYAREAIVSHLEELEDTYLAASRTKRPKKRWTQDELEAELDLDG